MIFKTEYLLNLLWIVLHDYMKMYEWLVSVEYDVIIVWCVFSFTWFVRNWMELLVVTMLLMLNMLNVDCWYWIYTCLMLIFGCGDCMYWIMLLNPYMQFDDDNCGVCMYEMCLFLEMIIWWMIGINMFMFWCWLCWWLIMMLNY